MTAQEAFSIAFDEVVAMDAAITNAAKANGNDSPAAMAGAGNSDRSLQSRTEHFKNGPCQAIQNGHPTRCPYYMDVKKEMMAKGMSEKEAEARALQMHGAASVQLTQIGQEKTEQKVAPEGGQPPQNPPPQNLQAPSNYIPPIPEKEAQPQVEALEKDPNALLNAPPVETEAKNIDGVQTNSVVQQAVAEVLAEGAENGNPRAEMIQQGLISALNQSTPEGNKDASTDSPTDASPTPEPEEVEAKKDEEREIFTPTNGGGTYRPAAEDAEIIKNNPAKREVFQKIVDKMAEIDSASTDEEKNALNQELDNLSAEFYDEGQTSEQPEEKPEEPQPEETPKEPQIASPDDEIFASEDKDNEYQVGNETYVDVSKMNVVKAKVLEKLAKIRGNRVITRAMREGGEWDRIKRSAIGEQVRDGIKNAIILNDINLASEREDISPQAKQTIKAIRQMVSMNYTPATLARALDLYNSWLDENGLRELTDEEKAKKALEDVHQGGKILGSTQKINAKGEVEDGGEAFNREVPTADILGKPGFIDGNGNKVWKEKAEIKNLEDKTNTILGKLADRNVTATPAGHTTSHNKTFLSFDISKRVPDKTLKELSKDIAFELGADEKDVSVTMTSKGDKKQLVIGIRNDVQGDVSAKEILQSDAWKKAVKNTRGPMVIGKTDDGKPLITNLKEMVHLLIAGETGKGKSVAINTVLGSLMMAMSPKKLKTVMIDLKKTELTPYQKSAHNAIPVATEAADAMNSLNFVQSEMKNRNKMLTEAGVHDIDEYNAKARAEGKEELPSMVLVIDELAECKKQCGPEFNKVLDSIGALARSTGIHIIAATQVPTKENIGSVKNHFPSRLAFRIGTPEGSQAILGSKKDVSTDLLTRKGQFYAIIGDGDDGKPQMGQGAAFGAGIGKNPGDTERIIDYWNTGKIQEPEPETSAPESSSSSAENEPKVEQAKDKEGEENQKAEKSSRKGINLASREEALQDIAARKKEATDKAMEAYEKDGGNYTKLMSALDKIDEEEQKYLALVNRLHPEPIGEGDNLTLSSQNEGSSGELPTSGSEEEPEWESPLAKSLRPENRIKKAQAKYERKAKELEKMRDNGELEDGEYLARLKKADEEYKNYVAAVKANKSDDDLDSEEKASNKAIKDSIDTHIKGKAIHGAEHISKGHQAVTKMPKALIRAASKNLPDGFVIDSDASGAPLWVENKYGFARNPKTGVYGKIHPDGTFVVKIDPTNPKYKKPSSEEAQAAYSKWQEIAEQKGTGSSEEKAALEEYSQIAFGVPAKQAFDESPDNQTIVASAIVKALNRMIEREG